MAAKLRTVTVTNITVLTGMCVRNSIISVRPPTPRRNPAIGTDFRVSKK
jgi:hypothetical protein